MNEPRPFVGRAFMCRRGPAARGKLIEDGKLLNPDVRPGFPVGQCIVHKLYGVGKIVAEHGSGDARTIDIDFEKHGRKSFLLAFASKTMRPEDAPT